MSSEAIMDIECRGISVAYQHLLALEDVSFSVPRGSFWGIIGPNGSGKSTLIRTILGLLHPVTGEVRVLGCPVQRLGVLRSRIGYVPQTSEIDLHFPLCAGDVVATGLYGKIGLFRSVRGTDREKIHQALERVDMAQLARRPYGELSGGQRQRILIARALVVQPQLLILDEPTTALDHSSTEGLYEWLHGLNSSEETTILLVSHDIGVVSRYVDTVACLNRRLVAHGRPGDVFNSAALEAMYGCGAVLFEHGDIPHMVVTKQPHQEHR